MSTLVKNPEDRFSGDEVHFALQSHKGVYCMYHFLTIAVQNFVFQELALWLCKQYSTLLQATPSHQSLSYELRHDKTNKMSVRPAKIRSHWASAQSDQSLRCLREKTLGP